MKNERVWITGCHFLKINQIDPNSYLTTSAEMKSKAV